MSRIKTFEHIRKWYQLIINEDPAIPILIVGNKKDLASKDEIKLYKQDLEELKKEFGNNNIYGYYF